ncbi:Exocyst complex component 1-like [Apodemus speciosus]
MSSLVKEDLQKKLFKPLAQKLCEFIEIEVSVQDRYYLCVSAQETLTKTPTMQVFSLLLYNVTKTDEVKITMVKHYRVGLDEKYEVTKRWSLSDLRMIDGKEADTDNPFFDLHFKKVYSLEAYSCASKYSFARTVSRLNHVYLKKDLHMVNFDSTYINDDSIWSSNNKDCLVLMRICFYAFNLVCLSLCPLPL